MENDKTEQPYFNTVQIHKKELSPLPPLFGSDFSKGNLNWKRLEGIEFESLGRILVSHLIIEHYLNKLIELTMPHSVDIDEANLNFMQKLKLMRNNSAFKNNNFYQGLTIVNKIRNKFSHHIEAKIDENELGILKTTIAGFWKSIGNQKPSIDILAEDYSSYQVIDLFTSVFCAFIAGYCSSIMSNW